MSRVHALPLCKFQQCTTHDDHASPLPRFFSSLFQFILADLKCCFRLPNKLLLIFINCNIFNFYVLL